MSYLPKGQDLPPLTFHEAKAILFVNEGYFGLLAVGAPSVVSRAQLEEKFGGVEVLAAWERLVDSAISRVATYEGTTAKDVGNTFPLPNGGQAVVPPIPPADAAPTIVLITFQTADGDVVSRLDVYKEMFIDRPSELMMAVPEPDLRTLAVKISYSIRENARRQP